MWVLGGKANQEAWRFDDMIFFVQSSGTKKYWVLGGKAKWSMEIWCHEFFKNWIGWIGKESNLFLGPVWFKSLILIHEKERPKFHGVFLLGFWRFLFLPQKLEECWEVVGKLMEIVLVQQGQQDFNLMWNRVGVQRKRNCWFVMNLVEWKLFFKKGFFVVL